MSKRIDRYLENAFRELGAWLRHVPQGRRLIAKEWDTAAILADVFLRSNVGPDKAVKHQSQIRIESQVGTYTARGWRGA